MDTPLVNGADRLRDDLWARSEALKRHPGFQCAAAKIGCALSHALARSISAVRAVPCTDGSR